MGSWDPWVSINVLESYIASLHGWLHQSPVLPVTEDRCLLPGGGEYCISVKKMSLRWLERNCRFELINFMSGTILLQKYSKDND